MSEGARQKFEQCSSPVFRMRICIYGHEKSGRIFVEGLLSVLREFGFRRLRESCERLQTVEQTGRGSMRPEGSVRPHSGLSCQSIDGDHHRKSRSGTARRARWSTAGP